MLFNLVQPYLESSYYSKTKIEIVVCSVYMINELQAPNAVQPELNWLSSAAVSIL
jgi:hypothetical protein